MQEKCDEGNVDALVKTPHATFNVFGMFDWVTKKGWPHIPRIGSKKDAIEEANSNNITNKVCGRELFKLFLQSPKHIKTNFFFNLPLTIVASIMNVPPIMAVPPTNAL